MNDDEEKVGYGRPPRRHQWTKGQSGNPSGRPRKQAPRLEAHIAAVFSEPLTAIQGGRPVEVSLLKASFKKLIHKGIKGDMGAATFVLGLADDLAQLHDDDRAEESRSYESTRKYFDMIYGPDPDRVEAEFQSYLATHDRKRRRRTG